MGTVTLGVSIVVPEPYGSLLQQQRVGFGDTAAQCIPTHVTLLPPTEVDTGDVPAFRRHLAEVADRLRPFRMRLQGTGTFRPLSAVVYVRLAEGIEDCGAIQELVRSGPVHRELQFPYHPHVTIAHDIDDEAMDRAYEELAGFRADWTVGGFALYTRDDDGAWHKDRDYAFPGGPASPSLPSQSAPLDAPVEPSLRP